MIYRRFGRTNLQMPVFSCGGMRFQQRGNIADASGIDPAAQANLEATIRRSLELGINHIETARGYGASELQLGLILPGLPRDRMIVQTKVGPTEDPKKFVESFNKSMSLLKLDHVDLLSIHGINTPETLQWAVRPGGCLAAARKLQAQGRCRWVGFSTHAPLELILEAIDHPGDGGFDYVNLHWYYIFQRNWPAVLAATRQDMGVFIISPSDKGGRLYDPPTRLVDLTRPLHPMVFNDLFCLSRPEVHTLSIGAARPTDFDIHVETLPEMERADQVLASILDRLEAAMRDATGHGDPEAHVWELPPWENNPGEMNLSIMLWLRNLTLGWGMEGYGRMRYNLLGNGGHWFPGLNAGRLDELDLEAVRRAAAGTPFADRIIDLLRETQNLLGGEKVKRLMAEP